MNSLDTDFHRRLKKKLDEEEAQQADYIIGGTLDLAEYKRQSGRINAIREVRDWCKEIESNMSQGK